METNSIAGLAEPTGSATGFARSSTHASPRDCLRGEVLAGFLFQHARLDSTIAAIFFVIAYLTGGWFAAQDVWSGLKQRKIDIQFLMIAVALGALFVSAWTEGATLLFLFSLSNALEQFANYRTRKSIESLLKVAPKKALRRSGANWTEVAVEQVSPSDELLVKAGELFPVDGVMIEGATSADESALTGEAIPVSKQIGDSVSGGALNLDGQCVIRVTRALEESVLNRILELIETAQQQKAPAQRFTDTFSRYYTWFALTLAVVVFGVLLAMSRPVSFAFYRAMTVLVVASPCALVLSIPSAILVAIAAGARRGILFRGGVAIENLAAANQFAFDKTGTLTKGTLMSIAHCSPRRGNRRQHTATCGVDRAIFYPPTGPRHRRCSGEQEPRVASGNRFPQCSWLRNGSVTRHKTNLHRKPTNDDRP